MFFIYNVILLLSLPETTISCVFCLAIQNPDMRAEYEDVLASSKLS